MRKDGAFKSGGLTLAAWLYLPDDLSAGEKAPAITMAHGLMAVKEQYLDAVGERFAAAGFVTLIFDYRHLGASEGEPRGQIFWYEQVEDYRNAITYLQLMNEVDPDRIGVWGTSFSGGHVVYLGAYDPRVKCIVSQAPALDIRETFLRFNTPEGFSGLLEMLALDRLNRYKTGQVNFLPGVSPDGTNCVMVGTEVYEWSTKSHETVAPNWKNQITVESIEKAAEYNPGAFIHLVSPTPLLMIVTRDDALTPVDLQLEAYQRAREPKELRIIPAGHFSVYSEPWQSKSAEWAADWFKQWL